MPQERLSEISVGCDCLKVGKAAETVCSGAWSLTLELHIVAFLSYDTAFQQYILFL
jgi:hypothetical protein